jgi:acetyl esterase
MQAPPIDPALRAFIDEMARDVPPPRQPDDLAAAIARYAAVSQRLPSVLVPVTAGDFKLRVRGKPLPARLYWPSGAQAPVLMAWFVGGGWFAGTVDTHDGLCRQLAHDLGVAVVSVQASAHPGDPPLLCCEDALLALQTLQEGRSRLGVDATRLLAGGDGSGAHLALQAAWRLQRARPASVDAVLALYPLAKPDFNTASWLRHAGSPVFSRDDAVRAWNGLLQGNRELWDERAVLAHGGAPLPNPPAALVLAAAQDGAHDDAIFLHDWMRHTGARCEFLGAPGMTHDFARMQHASPVARRLLLDVLGAFSEFAGLRRRR